MVHIHRTLDKLGITLASPASWLAVLGVVMAVYCVTFMRVYNTWGGAPQRSLPSFDVLIGCSLPSTAGRSKLLPDVVESGDMFTLFCPSKLQEFQFRLLAVNAPEINDKYQASLTSSASYFGISTNDTIRVGLAAQSYTRNVFTQRGGSNRFIVYTQWQRVQGSVARYWAHVVINAAINGHDDHTYLAEQLVHDGLAAVDRRAATQTRTNKNNNNNVANTNGIPAVPWPDGRTADSVRQHLTMLEDHAKAVRRGAWRYKPLLRKSDPPYTFTNHK